jgi:hypothetical protein
MNHPTPEAEPGPTPEAEPGPVPGGSFGLASIGALMLTLACTAPPSPETPSQTCAESEGEIKEIDQAVIAEFASPCDVDADCLVYFISADCPNGETFHLPDEAIAIDRSQEASDFVASRADQVCLPDQCFFPRYDNFYRYAYCDDGTCRGAADRPDEVCPTLARQVTETANELAQDLTHACNDDDDCVAFTPEFVCEEFELRARGCAVVLAVDEDIDVALQQSLGVYCQERHFSCDATDTACGEVAPACIDGVCVNNEG